MNAIDKVQLLAELADEHCHLNHGPHTDPTDYPASDYLVLPIGYRESDQSEVIVRELVIPVCLECAQALLGEEWTLLYCIECCASQWVCRELSRLHYRHHILWMRGCPKCADRLAGLYFNDFPTTAAEPSFLAHGLHLDAA